MDEKEKQEIRFYVQNHYPEPPKVVKQHVDIKYKFWFIGFVCGVFGLAVGMTGPSTAASADKLFLQEFEREHRQAIENYTVSLPQLDIYQPVKQWDNWLVEAPQPPEH